MGRIKVASMDGKVYSLEELEREKQKGTNIGRVALDAERKLKTKR